MDVRSRLAPYATLLMSQWLHRLCCDFPWLDRVSRMPSGKPDMAIYSCAWIVFECACMALILTINKMDLTIWLLLANPVTYSTFLNENVVHTCKALAKNLTTRNYVQIVLQCVITAHTYVTTYNV